jgi:hypothetical protein
MQNSGGSFRLLIQLTRIGRRPDAAGSFTSTSLWLHETCLQGASFSEARLFRAGRPSGDERPPNLADCSAGCIPRFEPETATAASISSAWFTSSVAAATATATPDPFHPDQMPPRPDVLARACVASASRRSELVLGWLWRLKPRRGQPLVHMGSRLKLSDLFE